MDTTDNILNRLESYEKFLTEKLSHLSNQTRFQLSVYKEGNIYLSEKIPYKKIGEIHAVKLSKKELRNKMMDELLFSSETKLDAASILTPRNTGVELTPVVIATMYSILGTMMSAVTDFIREYNGEIIMHEYTITHYNMHHGMKEYDLIEIASSWDDFPKLLGLSAMDFLRNPEEFISSRILKHSVVKKN